jgi:hypothetical protein
MTMDETEAYEKLQTLLDLAEELCDGGQYGPDEIIVELQERLIG